MAGGHGGSNWGPAFGQFFVAVLIEAALTFVVYEVLKLYAVQPDGRMIWQVVAPEYQLGAMLLIGTLLVVLPFSIFFSRLNSH